jgi:hypothetical protein
MYRQDTAAISALFQVEPGATLEKVVRFVLATIQQQFHTVPDILREWESEGFGAPSMWGMKREGVSYIGQHHQRLGAILHYLLSHGTTGNREEAIDALLEVPGLGVVKAAFAAQLIGFDTACLDTNNAQIYGVNPVSFAVRESNTLKTRRAKIAAYCTMTDKLGGPEQFWDTWCHYVANRYQSFRTAEQVSKLHVECIDLDYDVPF